MCALQRQPGHIDLPTDAALWARAESGVGDRTVNSAFQIVEPLRLQADLVVEKSRL